MTTTINTAEALKGLYISGDKFGFPHLTVDYEIDYQKGDSSIIYKILAVHTVVNIAGYVVELEDLSTGKVINAQLSYPNAARVVNSNIKS